MTRPDEITKLVKDIERLRREDIREKTKKILYDEECNTYFNYIVADNDEFCGVLFWNPRKSNPTYVTLGDPHLGDPLLEEEVEVYYKKLQNCIDITIDYENEITGEYKRQC